MANADSAQEAPEVVVTPRGKYLVNTLPSGQMVFEPVAQDTVDQGVVIEAEPFLDSCTYREDDDCDPDALAPVETPRTSLAVTGPLRSVDPSKINTMWQLIEQLTLGLPLNEYGLPSFVYRADMLDAAAIAHAVLRLHNIALPETVNSAHYPHTPPAYDGPAQQQLPGIQEINAQLDAATVLLHYSEGFPSLPSGRPFWQQLDFEPDDAYQAFTSYILLPGARKIADLLTVQFPTAREYYHLYYWDCRAKAFDLYQAVHHQKIKLQRVLRTEDSHYTMATRYLDKIGKYLDAADFDEEMTPDRAITMMEKLVKIQRISVGLAANGESKENDGSQRKVVPVNIIMQQLGRGSTVTKQTEIDSGALLDDPETLELAQQLIIRAQEGPKT